jgi:CRP-like cAMP-binding protein
MKEIRKINDTFKQFMYQSIIQIEYFKEISNKFFHLLLYQFKMITLEQGERLLKEGDDTEQLYIVMKGCLNIYTEFEGNEFLLAKLPKGSVLNYRVIFLEDQMLVRIQADEFTFIQCLHEKAFAILESEDFKF